MAGRSSTRARYPEIVAPWGWLNIGASIRRLLVRQHQAKRAFEARIDAVVEERQMFMEYRRRVLENQLDEPGYIELRHDRGGYGDY